MYAYTHMHAQNPSAQQAGTDTKPGSDAATLVSAFTDIH